MWWDPREKIITYQGFKNAGRLSQTGKRGK